MKLIIQPSLHINERKVQKKFCNSYKSHCYNSNNIIIADIINFVKSTT